MEMKKKPLHDLSDLKFVFSTNPEAKPEQEELANQKENSVPLSKQSIRITVDKKHRAGKEVTLIEGLEMNENELQVISKSLKSKCGIGGGVTEDGLLLLQGDQRKKLPDILIKMGFKKIKVI